MEHEKRISSVRNIKRVNDLGLNRRFGEKNHKWNGGNSLVGNYPCPICGKPRRCEKRDSWRKCKWCNENRPKNFSPLAWHKKTKIATKLWAINYKGGKCARCGVPDLPSVCYQFHHTDPSVKEENPGRLMSQKPSERLRKELDKCILVCANCHAIIEYGSATDLTALSYS